MRLIVTDVPWFVCLWVCLLNITMNPTKTDDCAFFGVVSGEPGEGTVYYIRSRTPMGGAIWGTLTHRPVDYPAQAKVIR